jgi:hypothetical protein
MAWHAFHGLQPTRNNICRMSPSLRGVEAVVLTFSAGLLLDRPGACKLVGWARACTLLKAGRLLEQLATAGLRLASPCRPTPTADMLLRCSLPRRYHDGT